MIRLFLRIPTGESDATRTPDLRAAIAAAVARWVTPQPGTVSAGGYHVADALCADSADISAIATLAPQWGLLGAWRWDEASASCDVLVPLDATTYLAHLPPPVDANGQPTGDPATLHEPHRWAGWPACY